MSIIGSFYRYVGNRVKSTGDVLQILGVMDSCPSRSWNATVWNIDKGTKKVGEEVGVTDVALMSNWYRLDPSEARELKKDLIKMELKR